MKPVLISELKNRLSHYLRAVRRGETVFVADRDRVIARIDAVRAAEPAASGDSSWLEELERRGTLRRARRKLGGDWLRERPEAKGDAVRALLDERDDGR